MKAIVAADAIGPGRGPRQLIPGESRCMNLNNNGVMYTYPDYPSLNCLSLSGGE